MGERLRDFDELTWIAPLNLARDLEVQRGSLTTQQARVEGVANKRVLERELARRAVDMDKVEALHCGELGVDIRAIGRRSQYLNAETPTDHGRRL
jgi:hypothetical protein